MPEPVPGFIITSRTPGHEKWVVRLTNCDRVHAYSVRDQLEIDPSVPDVLDVAQVDDIYADHVDGTLTFQEEPVKLPGEHRSVLARIFGG